MLPGAFTISGYVTVTGSRKCEKNGGCGDNRHILHVYRILISQNTDHRNRSFQQHNQYLYRRVR